jgi:hypothetical protein
MGQESARFGRWEVDSFAEQTIAGVAYHAHDPESGARGVIRVPSLPDDWHEAEAFRAAFLARIETVRQFSHPVIVPVRDAGTDEESRLPFVVYEHVEGRSLAERLRAGQRLTDREIVEVGAVIASALDTIHEHGIVHGSLSPSSILITPSGLPRLADLGFIPPDRSPFDRSGQFGGEGYFMAPEQVLSGPLDGRADLFSLGSVLFLLLTGEPPFAGRPQETLDEIVGGEPPLASKRRADVPGPLNAIVFRLLQKDPARRPARGAEVVAALETARQKLAHHSQPASAIVPPRRRPPRAAVLACLALAAGLATVLLLWGLLSVLPARAPAPAAPAAAREPRLAFELAQRVEEAFGAGEIAEARRLLADAWGAGAGSARLSEIADRVEQAARTRAESLIAEGNRMLARRRWEEASAAFALALDMVPGDFEATRGAEAVRRGWLAEQTGKEEGASVVVAERPTPTASSRATLRLTFGSPLVRGTIEALCDGRPLEPVLFDFSRGRFMGIERKSGGLVQGSWNLSSGTHRVAIRLRDGQGRELREELFEITVTPDREHIIRVEMSNERASPRFYLAQQKVR